MKIPLTIPSFDNLEEKAVAEVLRSGWVAQGPKVIEFEEMMSDYVGAKYAAATTSATTALFLSLYILGIGPGDEVVVPSFTFIATVNIVMHTGAKPVFVDIDAKTYNIDSSKIESAITPRTKAIMPVDQVGLPSDLEKIIKTARKHKLFVVEDAACGLGSVYKGRKLGSYPGIEMICLSFHPRKSITTGEGGMILTNNKIYYEKVKTLRHHGMSVSDLVRHSAKKVIHESYPEVGYNFRMSDIQAAVGVEQLKKLSKFLKIRRKLAERYSKSFENSKNIIPPFVPRDYKPNWQSYVVKLKKNKKITRNSLMQKLLDDGIATRRGVMASHLEPPYRKLYPNLSLPITEEAAESTIALPLYTDMTDKEQKYVIEKVLKYT